jgi:hypothetical protein
MDYLGSFDSAEAADGFAEGIINAVISVVITYGIHRFLQSTSDLDFVLAAVAATAFFTGYFTLTTGGVSMFQDR